MNKTKTAISLFVIILFVAVLAVCPEGVLAEDKLDSYARAYHAYEKSKEQVNPILRNIRDSPEQKVFKEHMDLIREKENQQRV